MYLISVSHISDMPRRQRQLNQQLSVESPDQPDSFFVFVLVSVLGVEESRIIRPGNLHESLEATASGKEYSR